MAHNAVLIGGIGVVASVAAWLLCRLSGYTVAAWAAPLAIGAFCLGLFIGAENTRGEVLEQSSPRAPFRHRRIAR